MGSPSVRASWCRGLLAAAAEFGPNGPHLLAAVPDDTRAEIDGALGISWLSFETYYDLIETLRLELGPRRLEDLFSDYVASLQHATLYKPLLRGIAVFGRGAESMLRLYAKGYALSFRNTGTMTVEPRPDGPGVIVTLRDVPELCREIGYAHGHAGSIRGGFRLADARARVDADLSRFSEGVATFVAEQRDPDDDSARGDERPPPSTVGSRPFETLRATADAESDDPRHGSAPGPVDERDRPPGSDGVGPPSGGSGVG